MLYVFLGKNVDHNVALTQFLEHFHLEYKLLSYSEIDNLILDFCMLHTSDCFDFLSERLKSYQSRNDVTYSQLCQEVLADVERNIKFPLVIKDDVIYAGLTNEEAFSVILPKQVRFILSRNYLTKSRHLEFIKGKAC